MTDYPASAPDRVDRPVMLQGWKDLTFVHFAYDPTVVQRRLPPGLVVDTFEGCAWVGLVAFRMEGIRLPHLPPVPYLGTFPETNVRTYVRGPDGRPGVWFDSLDVNRLIPVLVALGTYRLPYRWAEMSIEHENDTVSYRARRRWPGQTRSHKQYRCQTWCAAHTDRSRALSHRPLGSLQRVWAGGSVRSRRSRSLAAARSDLDRFRRSVDRSCRISCPEGRCSGPLLARG